MKPPPQDAFFSKKKLFIMIRQGQKPASELAAWAAWLSLSGS